MKRSLLWILLAAISIGLILVTGRKIHPTALAQGQPAAGSILDRLLKLETELKKVTASSKSTVPVGTVVAFAGPESSVPKSWRPCNGQTLDWGDYSDLAKTIGTTYGGRQGSTLRLPDYRGYFLRGLDGGAGRDPDGARRQLGSAQEDILKSHRHLMTGSYHATGLDKNGYPWGDPNNSPNTEIGKTGDFGGPETRPKNIAVHWIIKVKP